MGHVFPFLVLHTEPRMYSQTHLITGAGPETPVGPSTAVAAKTGTAFTWGSHTHPPPL